MKTFSRLSLLTLVFLGCALMLVGGAADAQEASLEVLRDTFEVYEVGDTVEVRFLADPSPGVAGFGSIDLIVNWVGVDIEKIDGQRTATAPVTGSSHDTDSETGILVVQGQITSSGAFIEAYWSDEELTARANLTGRPDAPRILVMPPDVNATTSRSPLQVSDTFTQEIWAIDFLREEDIDLSAWQMDITFNPEILALVSVTEGDFLEDANTPDPSDDVDAVFMYSTSGGKISAYQARVGRQTDETVAPPIETLTSHVRGVTGSGLLLTVEFKLLEFAEEALGLSNIQLSNSNGDRVSYHTVVNPVVATHRFPAEDVDRDGMVNVMDLVKVAGSLGKVPSNPRTDVNDDGFVNILDLMAVASSPLWGQAVTTTPVVPGRPNDPEADGLAAPSISIANVTPEMIQKWIEIGRIEDDGSAIFDLGIANLEVLLASMIPTDTRLLLNYPNPFNPETWIPYQLSESTDVTVTIHSMNGSLIRTLELGHQASGTYQSKSQAAYWDGRNEFGEQVASGLYFYTLTAGNFSATGKMLVRK